MKECIVLAAGLSTRMGCWKMQLPWGNGTVLDSALANALRFCDKVILVTGHRGAEIQQRYARHPAIQLCHNERYREGMFSSVKCGVTALSSGHFFVVPGDMPAIAPTIYQRLWQNQAEVCLQPCFDGGRGHPVLLPPALAEAILNAPAQTTLRTLMQAYGRKSLPVDSCTIHWDLDTPEHYQSLAKPELATQDHIF